MKINYDTAQIASAIKNNLIPENDYFPITYRLVEKVALLKITDISMFNSKSKGKRNGLLRLYFKTSALNLLKYRCTISNKGKEGFVYLMEDTTRYGYTKIGKSKEPERRLMEANCFSPSKSFKIFRMFFFENALGVEAELHKHFNEDRLEGEWFSINPQEVVNYLTSKTHHALLAQLDRAT